MKKSILTFLLLAIASVGFAQAPTTNADDPESRDAENVISIYGDFYDTIDGVNYDPNWGQSGHTQVNPAFDPGTGDLILAYPNFNYQGTEFAAQNAAGMEFLHVDIFVPAGTDRMVKVSPIDNSGSGAGEVLVTVPVTPGSWNSVDLPIEDFTGMTWQSVIQLKFDGQFNSDGSANTTPFDIYVDNIFFWKNAESAASVATLSDLKVDGETIGGFDPAVQNYTVDLPSGTTTVPQITSVNTTNANATTTITQATGIPGEATVEVVSEDGTNERIYTVTFVSTTPGEAAPTPPARNPSDVLSVYSDAYSNLDVTSFATEWSQGSLVDDVEIETGQFALRYDIGNFIGIQLGSGIDLTDFTHMHFDYWVADGSVGDGAIINPKLSNHAGLPGTEGETSAIGSVNPVSSAGEWASFDVPLDDFTAEAANGLLDRESIYQILLTTAGTINMVYIDNLYFYREGSAVDATIEAFSLTSPPDETTLELTGDGTDEAVIEWTEAESNTDVTYTWHADTPGSDFSEPAVSIGSDNSGQATTLTLSFSALDQTLDNLGVEEGGSITLDWTVTAMAGDSVRFADEIFEITLVRNLNVSNEVNESPNTFALNQNYPNPFNPTTNISYTIPESGDVTLEVFNIQGQRIITLVNGRQSAGSHIATFDASNLASGVYTYRLVSGNFVQVRKMLLIK